MIYSQAIERCGSGRDQDLAQTTAGTDLTINTVYVDWALLTESSSVGTMLGLVVSSNILQNI